jgi:hypothetical protein
VVCEHLRNTQNDSGVLTKEIIVGGFVCVPILYEAICNMRTLHNKIWMVLLYLFGLSLQQLNSFQEGNYSRGTINI